MIKIFKIYIWLCVVGINLFNVCCKLFMYYVYLLGVNFFIGYEVEVGCVVGVFFGMIIFNRWFLFDIVVYRFYLNWRFWRFSKSFVNDFSINSWFMMYVFFFFFYWFEVIFICEIVFIVIRFFFNDGDFGVNNGFFFCFSFGFIFVFSVVGLFFGVCFSFFCSFGSEIFFLLEFVFCFISFFFF